MALLCQPCTIYYGHITREQADSPWSCDLILVNIPYNMISKEPDLVTLLNSWWWPTALAAFHNKDKLQYLYNGIVVLTNTRNDI